MKWRMHENSLFAILLRSRWWYSFIVAAALFGVARLFIDASIAIVVPLPFVVIGCMAAWRQFNTPGAARVAAMLDAARAMTWQAFSAAIEEAYRRDGYGVTRIDGVPGADLQLERDRTRALVACKRWKAARAGIEPLRELHAAKQAHDASECAFVTAGEPTDAARAFAAEHGIRLVHGAELAKLLSGIVKSAG